MSMSSFIKKCSSSLPTTGTKGCKINMQDIVKAIFAKKGTKLNTVNDTLDEAKIDELVAMDRIVVMPLHTYTAQPEATVYQTLSDGNKNKIRDGKYEFLLAYTNKGVCFGNKLGNFSSIEWDVWLVDSKGTLYMTKDGVDFVGFSTNIVDRDSVTINDASSNVTTYNLIVQLDAIGTEDFYNNVHPITGSTVNLLRLEGVNDVTLEISGAITGDSIPFKANISCDGSTTVIGMESFARVTNTSGISTFGTATFVNGIYDFKPSTTLTAGNYVLDLFDKDKTLEVIKDSEGSYYKSNDLAFSIT